MKGPNWMMALCRWKDRTRTNIYISLLLTSVVVLIVCNEKCSSIFFEQRGYSLDELKLDLEQFSTKFPHEYCGSLIKNLQLQWNPATIVYSFVALTKQHSNKAIHNWWIKPMPMLFLTSKSTLLFLQQVFQVANPRELRCKLTISSSKWLNKRCEHASTIKYVTNHLRVIVEMRFETCFLLVLLK